MGLRNWVKILLAYTSYPHLQPQREFGANFS
jgi:hypothetical protein